MKRDTFTIDYRGSGANIPQTQVLAAAICQMVKCQFSPKNKHLLAAVPLPAKFKTWEELNDYCKEYEFSRDCKLLVDKFDSLTIPCGHTDHSFPDMIIFLALSSMQDVFQKLNDKEVAKKEYGFVNLVDDITSGFILINNYIGDYFYNLACDNDTFDWNDKYLPLYPDLGWMRQLKGDACFFEENRDSEHAWKIIQTELQEFATQCRYLSFCACLLQIVSFQKLSSSGEAYIRTFAENLMALKKNVYVHHVIVESSDVTETIAEERGENDHTTRLKVFFTFENGKPLVARFDMPHKGVGYLHLNLEDENGNSVDGVDHCKISSASTAEEIMSPFESSLITFGINAIRYDHAPAGIDKDYLERVKVERALFGMCAAEWGTLLLSDDKKDYDWVEDYNTELSEDCRQYIRDCRKVVNEYAESYGITLTDFTQAEVFDFVYDKLFND